MMGEQYRATDGRDDLPGWDDRKRLLEIWQEHAPLPDVGLRDGIYDALLAVASWGYFRCEEEHGLNPDAYRPALYP